jgi:hypothetical protein
MALGCFGGLPQLFSNPTRYPHFQAAAVDYHPTTGPRSLWLDTLISFLKHLAIMMPLSLIAFFVMAITGGPATFLIFGAVAAVLSATISALRFASARCQSHASYDFLARYASPAIHTLFAGTVLLPLIQGGSHALFAPIFFQGGFPTITANFLSGGYSLSPLGPQLTSLGTHLGQTGSQFFVPFLGSITSIIGASLLFSLSKQAAKLDPDLSSFLWTTGLIMIVNELVNTIVQTIATGNPLLLLQLPLILLAYPLILLFDWIMDSIGQCCARRPAAQAPGPAAQPQPPPRFVPFGGQGQRLGNNGVPPPQRQGDQLRPEGAAAVRRHAAAQQQPAAVV